MYIVGLTCKILNFIISTDSITDVVKHILIYRTVDCVYMITALIYILRTVEVQKYSIITLNSMMLVLFSKWGPFTHNPNTFANNDVFGFVFYLTI